MEHHDVSKPSADHLQKKSKMYYQVKYSYTYMTKIKIFEPKGSAIHDTT